MNTETNTEKPDSAAASGRVRRLVSFIECYDNDCQENIRYTDEDEFEYYDAETGVIRAVKCTACGLTNIIS